MTSFLSDNITPTNGYFLDWASLNANKLTVGSGEIKLYAGVLPPNQGETSLRTDNGTDLLWVNKDGKVYFLVKGTDPAYNKNWFYNIQGVGDTISLNFTAPSEIITIPPNHNSFVTRNFGVFPDDSIKYTGDSGFLYNLNVNMHFKIALGASVYMDFSVIIFVNGNTITFRKVTSKDDGLEFVPLSLTTTLNLNTNDVILIRGMCTNISTVNIEELDVNISQIAP